MSNAYLHGAFGKLMDSKTQSAVQSGTAPVYIGLARINLVRDYAEKNLVNNPVELINLTHAQKTMGWSPNGWDIGYGISEAITAHFDNVKGNTGPIYAINVLDPDVHRKVAKTTQSLTFINNSANIASDTIIIDTLRLEENVNVDLGVMASSSTSGSAVQEASYRGENIELSTVKIYGNNGTTLATADTDYTINYYNNSSLKITLLAGGILYNSPKIRATFKQTRSEGTDYTLNYNFGTSTLNIKLINENMSVSLVAEYFETDISAIDHNTIIGSASDYTGIYAVKKCFPDINVVPCLLCAPYWSENPNVYSAMVSASQKINGHWFAYTCTDIPIHYINEINKVLNASSRTAILNGAGFDIDTLKVRNINGVYCAPGADYTVTYDGLQLIINFVENGTIYSAPSIRITINQEGDNNTIAKAKAWKTEYGYNSEFSKVFWPQVEDGSGRKFHLSVLGMAEYMRVDEKHDDIPYESIDNKAIPAIRQYFGEGVNYYYDNEEADQLCAAGITTAISWGGEFVLWGPHTAAYTYGNSQMDARGIFDCTVRTLFYLLNGFQRRHIKDIGAPLTLRKVQEIMHEENSEYRRCKGLGALLGDVEIQFTEAENSRSDMLNGDFTWTFSPTVTPPLKSATLGVAYSDAGFESYFDLFTEEVQ